MSVRRVVFDTVFEAMISAHRGKSERMGFEYSYDEAGAGEWLKPGAWGCKTKTAATKAPRFSYHDGWRADVRFGPIFSKIFGRVTLPPERKWPQPALWIDRAPLGELGNGFFFPL